MRAFWGIVLILAAAATHAQDRTLSVSQREPSGQRLALVIGNSAYRIGPLRNPANDARAMADALKSAGFDVMHGENVSYRELFEMTRDFGRKLKPGVVALFYYAGHGMQVRDRNFLIPVEADPQSEEEVPYTSVDVNFLLDVMNRARSRVNIVILDACRNNPFARSFRSGSSGLAQMDAPSGTLIAYATAPGRVASDGTGEHGLYTQQLLKHLKTPGLPVEILFKRVREDVERETKSQQVPWESSSLKGDFYFTAAAPVAPPPPKPAPLAAPTVPDAALTTELAFWDSIKASQASADYQAYLVTYPSGRFAALAKARISALEKRAGQEAASLDADFWDSIKASSNPAEYQAYLDQFPKGRFASLAKARIQSLRVAASKPAAVTRPIPAQASPVAAVTATPPATTSPVAAGGKLPVNGEQWVYEFTDLWKPWKKARVTHSVSGAGDGSISEGLSALIDGRLVAGAVDMAARAEMHEWKVGDITVREFFPYAPSFDGLKPGTQFIRVMGMPSESNYADWTVNGKVEGEESITVPAGTFRATKVLLRGERSLGALVPGAGRFELTVWYAPELKRYVKLAYNSFVRARGGVHYNDPANRDIYELVRAPASGTIVPPAQPASAQIASLASTQVASGQAPRVGETYTYRYTDLWKAGRTIDVVHTVSAVRPQEIVETVSTRINNRMAASEAASAVGAEIREWKIGQITLREFAPFALAMDLLKPGQAPMEVRGVPPEDARVPEWSVSAQASEDEVTVPAGRFKATRLVLKGARDAPLATSSFELQVWYALEVKRYVKMTYDSFGWAGGGAQKGPHSRDVYELVSYPK